MTPPQAERWALLLDKMRTDLVAERQGRALAEQRIVQLEAELQRLRNAVLILTAGPADPDAA